MSTEFKQDPRYQQGKKFIQEKKYEDAINLFSSLLQSYNELHGEMSSISARAYYEYGNALLIKEEEEPSDDLIGPTDKQPPTPNEATSKEEDQESEGEDEEDEENAEDNKNGDDNEDGAETEESDLQVAWEVLDVARIILEKASGESDQELLAEVYVRLGDVQRMNGNMTEAVEEYNRALTLRSQITPNDHRILSNVHYLLAISHIYKSSESKTTDPLEERRQALQHYEASRSELQKQLTDVGGVTSTSSSSESSSKEKADEGEDKNEVKELVDELTETIDALRAEIAESENPKAFDKLLPQTTIGFGNSSTLASSTFPAIPATSSTPQSSTTGKNKINEVKSVQVKKKQKISHSAEPPNPPN